LRFFGSAAALLAPLAIVLVAPKDFLQDRIEDVVRAAFDEPRVVFEEFVHGFFEMYFSRLNCGCFLNDGHLIPPKSRSVLVFPITVEKKRGTVTCAEGGSDPTVHLGG
jgi:hypothetical protein